MARPLSELDPSASPLAAFAHDLRDVRQRAGAPTLEIMSQRANVSRSALSDAMSGKRLPSTSVLAGFLKACNCTAEEASAWLERRSELARLSERELTGPPAVGETAANAANGPGPSESQPKPSWQRAPFIAAALVLALVVVGAAGFAIGRTTAPPQAVATASSHPPRTGDDPVTAGCTGDAKVGATATQPDGTLVEMMWSAKCSANWRRITREDNLAKGNSISVKVIAYVKDAPNPQVVETVDQQSAFTPIMIVGPNDKVCVTGSRTVGDKTIEVTKPACG